jgi:hypothetical protein
MCIQSSTAMQSHRELLVFFLIFGKVYRVTLFILIGKLLFAILSF